mmetsp:Transcript_8722/g.24607  ORF Transcript_8722/g.24607 Transcript_8722/m.24607 type:complete len:111 (+) Transcript_8722:457-789(+)
MVLRHDGHRLLISSDTCSVYVHISKYSHNPPKSNGHEDGDTSIDNNENFNDVLNIDYTSIDNSDIDNIDIDNIYIDNADVDNIDVDNMDSDTYDNDDKYLNLNNHGYNNI